MIWLTAAWAQTTVAAGYQGAFVFQPGLYGSVDRAVTARGDHTLIGSGRAGGFHHRRRHTALFVRGELGYRLDGRSVQLDVLPGLGVHHTILAGPVYTTDDAGVRRVRDAGRPTVAVSLGTGIGVALDPSWRVRGRLDLWTRAPVNAAWLPGVAVAVGLARRLGTPP
jgi:hypothetical protein